MIIHLRRLRREPKHTAPTSNKCDKRDGKINSSAHARRAHVKYLFSFYTKYHGGTCYFDNTVFYDER